MPILCIHPPLLTGETFQLQLRGLANSHQVIVPDLRGHGRSRNANGAYGQKVDYQQIAEDLIKLHEWMKLPPALVLGYSTGGGLVIELLRLAPDRFIGGIIVSGMAIVDDAKLKREIQLAKRFCKRRMTRFLLMLRTSYLNSSSTPMAMDLFRTGMQGDADAIAEYYDASLAYDGTPYLHQIRQPVLLVYGQQDLEFEPYHRQFIRDLPESHSMIIRAKKHQLPSQAAPELHEEIRRWSRQFVV